MDTFKEKYLKELYMNQNSKLLVVIVTYNAMTWIDRCVKSLFASSLENDIYIVDNGSNDGTKDYIKTNYPFVKLFESDENLGFGKANNIGLTYAINESYDFVYLINQDAWVMPDTLEKLVKTSIEHPNYGILSPMQLQANLWHFDNNFGANLSNWNNTEKFCERLYFQYRKGIYDVERVMAAHWLLTMKCITSVGGFSPSFPHYGEDDNYAERTLHKGLKIGVVLDAVAVHDREQRKMTTKQIIYMSFIQMITSFSGWKKNNLLELVLYGFRCIKYVFKYKTILPVIYFITFISKLNEIKKNKELSELETAFLQNDKK